MSAIRRGLVYATINRVITSMDYTIYNNVNDQNEFIQRTILADNTLTNDEKSEAIRLCKINYDRIKIIYNINIKRICENCNQECIATSYCENCVRDYLKLKFSNWSSGNNDVDNLIQKCQLETVIPNKIIEWIPYNQLENIKYLAKGGFSEIYTADWIGGRYEEWDSKEYQLIRSGNCKIVLKKLENVESANQRWFEEVCSQKKKKIKNKYSKII
jgi:hypothetical protein